MNIAAPQPTAAHRAALNLHALAEPDRHWVLQALTGEQQAALQPLLRELEELGIPRDADLARAFATAAAREDNDGAGALQALDDAGVRRLAALLAGEPPRLAAAVLVHRAWPWRERLMAELPVATAQAIRSAMGAPPAASALQAFVVAELGTALRAQHAVQPPRRSLWQTMRHRFGALRGRQ
jgi:hypothetical protein